MARKIAVQQVETGRLVRELLEDIGASIEEGDLRILEEEDLTADDSQPDAVSTDEDSIESSQSSTE